MILKAIWWCPWLASIYLLSRNSLLKISDTVEEIINSGVTAIKSYLATLSFESESECEVSQSCPTLCDDMDCSLPGSSVHGIFQARILEWVAISFSRGSSPPRDRTWVSHIVGKHFTVWTTREIFTHGKKSKTNQIRKMLHWSSLKTWTFAERHNCSYWWRKS